jgi:hypothetical protein
MHKKSFRYIRTLDCESGLTIFIAFIGYVMHEKFNELKRIDILLNKTREEVARDNVTKAEIERIVEHIDATV